MYIDESGDCGMKGSKYLVLSALLIKEPKDLDKIIKNMRRNKFKKTLNKITEIKANNSSKEVIKFMLNCLNKIENSKIFFVVLEKNKVSSNFLRRNSHKLYNFVAGKLAKNLSLNENFLEIKIDKSKGGELLRKDFDNYFLSKLLSNSNINNVSIHHSYSHSWSGLQFADILAWSCFQKFEHQNSEFMNIIKIERRTFHLFKKKRAEPN